MSEARELLEALVHSPVFVEPALSLIASALEIAATYDRAIYDALFVALAEKHGLPGITSDEPLFNAIKPGFPRITLLRDFQ